MNLNLLGTVIQSGVPALLIGPPGSGKTSWVRSFGRGLDLPTEVLVGSIIDPTDVGGLPAPHAETGTARYLLPDWFVRLRDAGRGILFLDELTCSSPAVQAALLRVIAERAIHGHQLPAGVLVLAAANPPEQAAGGWDLAAPLANRLCHLPWQVEPGDWVDGMLNGWEDKPVKRLPAGWEGRLSEARAWVGGYIRHSQGALLQLPKDEARRAQAWPSPRTWDLAARAICACWAAQESPDDAITGLVGEGAAIAFLSWCNALDLPDPEALLANPDRHELPARDDALFVALGSLAAVVEAKPTVQRWQAAWIVMERVAERSPDIGALAARRLAQKRPRGAAAPVGAKAYLPLLRAMEGGAP